MAFLNEIGTGRHNRFFQKFFNMKGGPPARSLASDVIAVLPLFHGRENRYLEDWRTYAGHINQAAVAAQDTVARLSNPIASNVIAVVESITLWSSSANVESVIEHAPSGNNGALTQTFTPAQFDSRLNPPGTGSNGAACILSSTNNIGQGNHVIAYDVVTGAIDIMLAELINYDNAEIQLLPGADLQIRTLTLNVVLVVNLRWRERPLEDSEFK